MNQYNKLPNFNVPLTNQQVTEKNWYFFWAGLFRGLPPGNVEPIAVGTSPFVYSAPAKGFVLLSGGTVSAVAFSRDGVTYYATGVPRNAKIPRNADPAFFDLGLCGPDRAPPVLPANAPAELTQDSLCGKFRMPTLRNAAEGGAIATMSLPLNK